MPIITSFADIDKLTGKKAKDRREGKPKKSGGEVATDFFKAAGFGSQASASPSQPMDPNAFAAEQQRAAYAGNLNGRERVGFILTSDLWIEQNTVLALHAGPSSANWSLALRAAEEENQSGHARYAMARKVGIGAKNTVYFDVPRIDFTFQTGNILPIPFVEGPGGKMPHGLEDFYYFKSLLNQPPLIPSGSNEGKHNFTWVFYRSLMYPDMTLKGYFDPQGIAWADSTDSPAGFTWTATFIAHETDPALWDPDELASKYANFDFTLF